MTLGLTDKQSLAPIANRVDFDDFAGSYDNSLDVALRSTGENKAFYCEGRIQLLRGLLLHKPNHILDFGCGTGSAVPLLQHLATHARVTGVDVSAKSLDIARRCHPTAKFCLLSSAEADYVSRVDLVHVNGVFHHIPPCERQAWLEWISKRMVPDGVLAIFENNPWNPGTRYVMSNCEFDRDAVMLSALEVRRRMRRAGFIFLGCWHLFFFPRVMRWFRFAEPFIGGIYPGAMPFLHRYLGNPVLSWLGRVFFGSKCGDFHCGLRGFTKVAYQRMGLRTTGMEFASEMVVKASLFRMQVSEIPTTLSPDGRDRAPHLRTWRDGWRHLRFLLLYSPRWLFLYPGILMMLLGLMGTIWLLPGPRTVGRLVLDIHTLTYSASFVLLGFQAVAFAAFTKVFAISHGLMPPDERLNRLFRTITLEVGLASGAALTVLGLAGAAKALGVWEAVHFGELDPRRELRLVIPSATLLTLGVQTILCSFFLSVLGMSRSDSASVVPNTSE